jgi:hypothetical protein
VTDTIVHTLLLVTTHHECTALLFVIIKQIQHDGAYNTVAASATAASGCIAALAIAVVTVLKANTTALVQGALCDNSNHSQHNRDCIGKRDVMPVHSAHSIVAIVCSCMPNVHRGDARRSGK